MKAQDTVQTKIRYDLYLEYRGKHFFCKRYHRESAALHQAKELERLYGKWGYTTKIIPIDLIPPGLRIENGDHTVGLGCLKASNQPTERPNVEDGSHIAGTPSQEQDDSPTE